MRIEVKGILRKLMEGGMKTEIEGILQKRMEGGVMSSAAPGFGCQGLVALEQVHKNAETKGVMDSWPEDVKAMLAAGRLREEAIRAAELPKLPELGAKEAGPLAAGDWLAEIRPIMMDLSASAAVWWEHIMRHAEKAYQRWLDMRPVERLNVVPEEPGWLGKYLSPGWSREGPGFCFGRCLRA